MKVSELVNGARLPNWAWLAIMFAALGFQFATVVFGGKEAVGRVVAAIDRVAVRDSINYTNLTATLNRRTDQINAELHQVSVKTGYIARKVE